METFKPVIFKLKGESYGIDIDLVNGIEQEQRVVPVPNAPGYIKGIINLRGNVIPVYSLCQKFGFADCNLETSQLIITRMKEMLVAIEVEGVNEIFEIEQDQISMPPRIIRTKTTSYISRIAKVDKNMIIILDVENLLSDEEQEDIQQFLDSQS